MFLPARATNRSPTHAMDEANNFTPAETPTEVLAAMTTYRVPCSTRSVSVSPPRFFALTKLVDTVARLLGTVRLALLVKFFFQLAKEFDQAGFHSGISSDGHRLFLDCNRLYKIALQVGQVSLRIQEGGILGRFGDAFVCCLAG